MYPRGELGPEHQQPFYPPIQQEVHVIQTRQGRNYYPLAVGLSVVGTACVAATMMFLNAHRHFFDTKNKATAKTSLTDVEVRVTGGTLGNIPMLVPGLGQRKLFLRTDPTSKIIADTEAGIYFPDMANLHMNYQGMNGGITVTENDAQGQDMGIDASKIQMEPYEGQECDSRSSNNLDIFMCEPGPLDTQTAIGRTDLTANSGTVIGSDDHIIDDALQSFKVLGTDKYCINEQFLKPNGMDWSWIIRAAVRRQSYENFNIPPSFESFNMQANTTADQPITARMKALGNGDAQLPFKGSDADINAWCAKGVKDSSGRVHNFVDQAKLNEYLQEVKAWGAPTIAPGTLPDDEGGMKNDPQADQAMRQKIDSSLANKSLVLF